MKQCVSNCQYELIKTRKILRNPHENWKKKYCLHLFLNYVEMHKVKSWEWGIIYQQIKAFFFFFLDSVEEKEKTFRHLLLYIKYTKSKAIYKP